MNSVFKYDMTTVATHFEKITHFEKFFQSALNLGPAVLLQTTLLVRNITHVFRSITIDCWMIVYSKVKQ